MNPVPLPAPIQIQPLVAAGPQPNFPALDQTPCRWPSRLDGHLQGIGLEISRLSNLPAQADAQNFQVLNANVTAVINGVNQLIQITQNIQNMVQGLQNTSAAFRYQ